MHSVSACSSADGHGEEERGERDDERGLQVLEHTEI
jgi:hypothetical protein